MTVNQNQDNQERQAFAIESAEYFELARDLLCTASLDGYFTRVNPAWERTLGYSEEQLLSRPYVEFIHPDDRKQTLAQSTWLGSGGTETVSFENRYRAADGAYHWFEWTAWMAKDAKRIFAAARDVTEDKQGEQDSRLLAAIVRSTDDGVISTALNGVVTSWNSSAERIYGYSAEEMIGRSVDLLLPPHRAKEDLGILAELVTAKGGVSRMETERVAKNGSLVPISLTASQMRNEDGKLTGVSWMVRDVTDRKRLEAEIEYSARQDPVTGVCNRRHFERELLRQLTFTRRYGAGGAVLLLDLDGFEQVNEMLGREAGDQALGAVAQTLIDRLRTTDTIARLDADRFGILLPHAEAEPAHRVAQQLVDRVGESCERLLGPAGDLTCSVGIVSLEEQAAAGVEDLMTAARRAVAEAKRDGGGRVALSNASIAGDRDDADGA